MLLHRFPPYNFGLLKFSENDASLPHSPSGDLARARANFDGAIRLHARGEFPTLSEPVG